MHFSFPSLDLLLFLSSLLMIRSCVPEKRFVPMKDGLTIDDCELAVFTFLYETAHRKSQTFIRLFLVVQPLSNDLWLGSSGWVPRNS